ncbi:hypothetical protein IWX49DRAFT_119435 [Phyllosticta citricarpa]|uniref:Transmembrane protein n=2 Tax=Phyllosticta TaxID=121621 RepID=A0ABR1MEZ6_9PEZI
MTSNYGPDARKWDARNATAFFCTLGDAMRWRFDSLVSFSSLLHLCSFALLLLLLFLSSFEFLAFYDTPPLFSHSLTPLLPPSPSTSIFHLGFYAYARSRGTTYISTYPSPPVVQARHASPSLLLAIPPSICLVPLADGKKERKKKAGSRHRKSLFLPLFRSLGTRCCYCCSCCSVSDIGTTIIIIVIPLSLLLLPARYYGTRCTHARTHASFTSFFPWLSPSSSLLE